MAFEEPIELVQASMSRGEVSPRLFGRVDLQAYGSGLRTNRNGFVTTEGVWSNRPGFGLVGVTVNQVLGTSIMIPFVFNTGQAYAIEVVAGTGGGAGTAYIYFNGVALGAASGLGLPYQVADLAAIRWTQSADTLTLFHPNYVPQEIKRTSGTTFTVSPQVLILGPFLTQNVDGVTFVYASAKSGVVTLTATSSIFNPNHVGALFKLQQQDFSLVPPWEPSKIISTTGVPGAIGVLRRSNNKNYICVGAQGTPGSNNITTGSIAPFHTYGTQADGDGQQIPNAGTNFFGVQWQYQDSGFGIVQITNYIDAQHVTGIVQPNYQGGPGLLPVAVVGGPVVTHGPANYTGDGATVSFAVPASSTQTDPTRYYVTINGVYQAPSTFTITGAPTSLVFTLPPAPAAAVVIKEIGSLGSTTFWAFGAFSPDQGYPATGTYVPDRLIMAGTKGQPMGLFASQTSNYHNHGQSNPVVNSDAFVQFLNARQLNPITDLIPLQDLIVGTQQTMWRIYPGPAQSALGPLAIAALPQGWVGEDPRSFATLYADSLVYATYGGRRIRDLMYQFQFDKYMGQELTAYSRHLFPKGLYIKRIYFAPEPWSQVFVLRSDGQLMVCTYVREQQMIAWGRWDTGDNGTSVDPISGDPGDDVIEDICLIPENNSFALYLLITRTLSTGAVLRTVERMQDWEVTSNLDWSFADCALKYDGRNTGSASMSLTGGTTWAAGDTGTLTASSAAGWPAGGANFVASDVTDGNVIQLFDSSGNRCRVRLQTYISATQATVMFMDPITTGLQGMATKQWTFARTRFAGLATQLAGCTVTVLADSNYVGGRNGVTNVVVSPTGTIMIPSAAGVVTAGLQYFADFETLALNASGQALLRERAKNTQALYLDVTGTRGLMAGNSFDDLYAFKERNTEPPTAPQDVVEGIEVVRMSQEFDSESHICVRQAYPLPATIRMVIPQVSVGEPVG